MEFKYPQNSSYIYWGGDTLCYLRFLTIKTFMKYNPDWKIMFLYPKYPTKNISWLSDEQKYKTNCTDFLPELMKLPIEKVEVDFSNYGINNSISEVHKSDFIRLEQLSTMGGVWSDIDIIYIKPMNSLYFNTDNNKNVQTLYCDHNYGHSIGFLMGCENNKFFEKLKKISKEEYNPNLYQTMGSVIYKKYFSTAESINNLTPAFNMDMNVVYPHDATYFNELFQSVKPKITDRTIGVHWYAGSPLWTKFMADTDGGQYNLPNTIIGNLIKNEND